MTKATIMMIAVPASTNGFLLKAITKAIPTTEPGMMYGIIDKVSMTRLTAVCLLTTRYAIRIASRMTMIRAKPPIRKVFGIAFLK